MEIAGLYYFNCELDIGGDDQSVSIATDLMFPPTTVWAYPVLQQVDTSLMGNPDYFIAKASVDHWVESTGKPPSGQKHFTSWAVFEANCTGVAFWVEAANCNVHALAMIHLLA